MIKRAALAAVLCCEPITTPGSSSQSSLVAPGEITIESVAPTMVLVACTKSTGFLGTAARASRMWSI
jgi:hypothetical protein